MFPRNYFPANYFAPAYFPPAGEGAAEEKPRDALALGIDVEPGPLRERLRREDNEILDIIILINEEE
jgi:hypothetical protein